MNFKIFLANILIGLFLYGPAHAVPSREDLLKYKYPTLGVIYSYRCLGTLDLPKREIQILQVDESSFVEWHIRKSENGPVEQVLIKREMWQTPFTAAVIEKKRENNSVFRFYFPASEIKSATELIVGKEYSTDLTRSFYTSETYKPDTRSMKKRYKVLAKEIFKSEFLGNWDTFKIYSKEEITGEPTTVTVYYYAPQLNLALKYLILDKDNHAAETCEIDKIYKGT